MKENHDAPVHDLIRALRRCDAMRQRADAFMAKLDRIRNDANPREVFGTCAEAENE